MDIRIGREQFLQGLQRIQSVVERKTTTPILANFLLEARGTDLTYVATDLELTCKGVLAADVVGEGEWDNHPLRSVSSRNFVDFPIVFCYLIAVASPSLRGKPLFPRSLDGVA